MKTEIDLYKLCGIAGIETIQAMFDNNMINREQLEDIFYMWKTVNKETYKVNLKSFNDGNNEWEEIVYINSNDILKVTYQHTMGGCKDLEQVMLSKDKEVASKMLQALERVIASRDKFNLDIGSLKCARLLLKNQVINK